MGNRERRLPLLPMDIVTVLVCTVTVFFVLAFGGKALESYRLQRHNDKLRQEIAELEQETAELQARLTYVQSAEYVEQVAREQYKLVKPGEKLIIPIPRQGPLVATTPTPSLPTSETVAQQPASYWSVWWELLTGRFD
jgi:cell division protein FtsB